MLAAWPAAAFEVPMQSAPVPDELAGAVCDNIVLGSGTPSGTFKLPVLTAAPPFFGTCELGGSERMLVLDKKAADDENFLRLYFDSNGNNDLTDDTPVDGAVETLGRMDMVVFPKVAVKLEEYPDDAPYTVTMRAYVRKPGMLERAVTYFLGAGDYRMVEVRPTLCFKGLITMNDKPYSVYLLDKNMDGKFGQYTNVAEYGFACDTIALLDEAELAIDTAKQFDKRKDIRTFALPNYLVLGGTCHRLAYDASKHVLEMAPVTNIATVEMPMPMWQIKLVTEDKKTTVMALDVEKTAPIPPGKYRLVGYNGRRKAPDGKMWEASGRDDWPENPKTTVVFCEAGKTTGLPYGEPFRVGLEHELSKSFWGTTRAEFSFELFGQGGELARFAWTSDERYASYFSNPQEPRIKVLLPDGEIAWQGAFRYG